jgi:hypothetical protein
LTRLQSVFSIKRALGVTQKKPTIKKKVVFPPFFILPQYLFLDRTFAAEMIDRTISLRHINDDNAALGAIKEKSSATLTRAKPCATNPHS